jgi:5-methylcytosine-specific restriction endonuclease McrA
VARIRSIKPRDTRGHFIKKAIPAAVRRELAARHGCVPGASVQVKCAYCSFIGGVHWTVQPTDRGPGWVAFTGLEMDHVTAEINGGDTSAENIVLACQPCNRSKSIKAVSAWKDSHGARP